MQVLTNFTDQDFETNKYGRFYHETDFEIQDNNHFISCELCIQEYGGFYEDKDTNYGEFNCTGRNISIYSISILDENYAKVDFNKEEIELKIKNLLLC